ncbi:jerky protein homolog-like [Colletes gigas]|uniref:jerky protein homolog-like n=1 Tax=Colletes gigas TaxID=935657 RepID=UPI001C9B28B5|nr:jerky protein homolog-like [Colletes gigas]
MRRRLFADPVTRSRIQIAESTRAFLPICDRRPVLTSLRNRNRALLKRSMSSSNGSSRRVTLSLKQRLDVIQKLKTGVPDTVLANEYGVKTATIHRIKRNEVRIRHLTQSMAKQGFKRRRIRKPLQNELEARLYSWFLQRRALGDRISNSLLQKKAKELHEEFGGPSLFRASNGWVWNFKNRYDIRLYDHHHCSTTEPDAMTSGQFSQNFFQRLMMEDIKPQNVYNMAETRLLWKVLPLRTVFHASERNVCENKIKNDRVTVGLCANATGTHKLPPLFIYDFEKPRSLKHCWTRLPLVFKDQKNARMTTDVFVNWLKNHFKPAVNKHQFENGNRDKVLLLMDNSTVHALPADLQMEDDSVEVIFIPEKMAAALQPMSQGIVSKVKRSFRHNMLRRIKDLPRGIVEFYADYDVKDCMDFVDEAWLDVEQDQIRRSWTNLMGDQRTEEEEEVQSQLALDVREISETMRAIAGEPVPEERVREWLSSCEAAELDPENVYDDEEQSEKQRKDPESEETDRFFASLVFWSLTQPPYVQMQVQMLKDYYDQGYK